MEIKLGNPLKGSVLKTYPNGSITQIFGVNWRYYAKLGLKGHDGIDLYMPEGTPIVSTIDGYVYQVNDAPKGYGKYVRVWSDWDNGECLDTIQGHMSKITCKLGQRVKVGDELGIIGNTGFVITTDETNINTVMYWGNAPAHKGVHLHFGIRIIQKIDESNTKIKNYNNGFLGYIDPLQYMKFISNKKDMPILTKDNAGNQYIAFEDSKIAWSIPDPETLVEIKAYLKITGDAVSKDLTGWYVIHGNTALNLKNYFNL
jgi:murein DD-endopeptidase MepM/ murein hydrolase activator NlpD